MRPFAKLLSTLVTPTAHIYLSTASLADWLTCHRQSGAVSSKEDGKMALLTASDVTWHQRHQQWHDSIWHQNTSIFELLCVLPPTELPWVYARYVRNKDGTDRLKSSNKQRFIRQLTAVVVVSMFNINAVVFIPSVPVFLLSHAPEQTTVFVVLPSSMDLVCGTVSLMNWDQLTSLLTTFKNKLTTLLFNV